MSCFIEANGANDGGGIGAESSDIIIANSVVYSCGATGPGGGIYGTIGDLLFFNCSIVGNASSDSYGGGVYLGGSGDLTLRNTIVWGNVDLSSPPNEATQVLTGLPTVVIADNCCIQDLSSSWGTGYISSDPLFANAGSGDLRLTCSNPCSSCIDAGNNSYVSWNTDLAGNARVLDGNCDETAIVDMGAYEYLADCGG